MNRVREPKAKEILEPARQRYCRKQAAGLLDASVNTLYRWEKNGLLVPKRDRAGRAYYTPAQIQEFFQGGQAGV